MTDSTRIKSINHVERKKEDKKKRRVERETESKDRDREERWERGIQGG